MEPSRIRRADIAAKDPSALGSGSSALHGQRQCHHKSGASPGAGALGRDSALMSLDELLRNREPETDAP